MPDLSELQKIIKVKFINPSILELALVHSSFTNENPGAVSESNERMEFLGDAILGMVIAEELFHKFPSYTEGEMTTSRSLLVRRETLARLAKEISLGDFLYLGKGEEAGGGRQKMANLAGVYEALIAAIYLDRGWEEVQKFILLFFHKEVTFVISRGMEIDYKSRLQEHVQGIQQTTPSYQVIDASGPDHDRTFIVEVIIDNKVMGQGRGKTKKSAEAEAAKNAMENL